MFTFLLTAAEAPKEQIPDTNCQELKPPSTCHLQGHISCKNDRVFIDFPETSKLFTQLKEKIKQHVKDSPMLKACLQDTDQALVTITREQPDDPIKEANMLQKFNGIYIARIKKDIDIETLKAKSKSAVASITLHTQVPVQVTLPTADEVFFGYEITIDNYAELYQSVGCFTGQNDTRKLYLLLQKTPSPAKMVEILESIILTYFSPTP